MDWQDTDATTSASAAKGNLNPAMANVCFWHKADIPITPMNVRFWGNSGHRLDAPQCPLLTQSGHCEHYLRSFAHYHRAVTPTIGLRAQMSALAAADEPNPHRPTVVKTNANIQMPVNPGHQGTSPGKRTNSTNGMSANAMRIPFIQ